jgi:hypothetical protein
MSKIDIDKFVFRKFLKEEWLKCKQTEEQTINSRCADDMTIEAMLSRDGDPRFDENAARIHILESNCESTMNLLALICADLETVSQELKALRCGI